MVVRMFAAAVAAAVLGLGVVGCSADQPDPHAERGAEIARADGVYLERVRLELPTLADVDDDSLIEAALFACAVYGPLTETSRLSQLPAAARDLMRYGYAPGVSYWDAHKLANLTGYTCI